jgi:hypothetical protein
VSPAEVQRSADVVIAVVGLVFSGIRAARTILDWWCSRRAKGATVRILFSDGTQLDLSNVGQGELEVTFQQVGSQR